MTDYDKIYQTYTQLARRDKQKYPNADQFEQLMGDRTNRTKLFEYFKSNEKALGVSVGSFEGFEQRILPFIDARYNDRLSYSEKVYYSKDTPWWDKLSVAPTVFKKRLSTNLLRSMVTNNMEVLGGVLEWTLGAKDANKWLSSVAKRLNDNALYLHDPNFLDSIVQGAGSTASYFIPGLGVTKAAKAAKMIPKLAAWLGIAYGTLSESLAEAGGVYNESLSKGKTKAQASLAATNTLIGNLILNGFTNRWIGADTPVGKKLKDMIVGAGQEGAQEFLQELISSTAQGELTKPGTLKRAGEAGAVGAIVGVGMGAIKPSTPTWSEFMADKLNVTLDNPEALKVEASHRINEKATRDRHNYKLSEIKRGLGEVFLDTAFELKSKLLNTNPDIGERVILRKNLTFGASAAATQHVNALKQVIYKDLNATEIQYVHRMVTDKRTKELFRMAEARMSDIISKMSPDDVQFMQDMYGSNWQEYIKNLSSNMINMREAWFDRVPEETKAMLENILGSNWKQHLGTMFGQLSKQGLYYEGMNDQERASMKVLFGIDWDTLSMMSDMQRPGGVTPIDVDAFWENMRRDAPELFDLVNERSEALMQSFDGILDMYRKEGIEDDESITNMRQYKYAPTLFLHKLDPYTPMKLKYVTISVPSSGIKQTKHGAEETINYDYDKMLEFAWMRAYQRVMKNQANREMVKFANAAPDNTFVIAHEPRKGSSKQKQTEPVPVEEPPLTVQPTLPVKVEQQVPVTGTPQIQPTLPVKSEQQQPGTVEISKEKPRKPIPRDFVELFYFDPKYPGVKQSFYMHKDMAYEWTTSVHEVDAMWAKIMGYVSGARIVRPFATGWGNPMWGLIRNMPRDITYSLVTTKTFSNQLPLAIAQMGRQLGRTLPDAWSRKGRYVHAIAQGMGMDFLTYQGTMASTPKRQRKSIEHYLSYVNEFTEIWTRLAIREQEIERLTEQGVPIDEAEVMATGVARSYLDFNQGGVFTRQVLNNLRPYANPQVQAGLGTARALKYRPYSTSWKIFQASIMAALAGWTFDEVFNKAMRHVPGYYRKSGINFIVPGSKHLDEQGNERWFYYHAPIDESVRPLKFLAENIIFKLRGLPTDDVKAIEYAKLAFAQFFPGMGLSDLPPTMKAFIGMALGKDLWTGLSFESAFVKLPLYAERNKETAGFFDWLANQTQPLTENEINEQIGFKGISPKRTKYALSQYFPPSSFMVQFVGGSLNMMFEQLPPDQQQEYGKRLVDMLRKSFGSAIKETPPYLPTTKTKLQELRNEDVLENGRKAIQRMEFDRLLDDYFHKRAKEDKLNMYLSGLPKEDFTRLRDRWKNVERFMDSPNRSIWYSIMEFDNPTQRASAYYLNLQALPPDRRTQFESELRKVRGLFTPQFKRALYAITHQGGQK